MDPPATLCLCFASLEIRMHALCALQSGDKLIKGHPDDKNTITGNNRNNLKLFRVVLIENLHKKDEIFTQELQL